MLAVDCPVCGREGLEFEVCPQCATELGSLRLLGTLAPVRDVSASSVPAPSSPRLFDWMVGGGLGALMLALGLRFGLPAPYFLPRGEVASPPGASLPGAAASRSPGTPSSSATREGGVAPPRPLAPHAPPGWPYRVRRGDSLWAIAARFYGDGLAYGRILAANPALRSARLVSGQRLVIPFPEGRP